MILERIANRLHAVVRKAAEDGAILVDSVAEDAVDQADRAAVGAWQIAIAAKAEALGIIQFETDALEADGWGGPKTHAMIDSVLEEMGYKRDEMSDAEIVEAVLSNDTAAPEAAD